MKHRFAVALAGAAAVLVGGGALALGAASSLPKANLTVAQTAGMRSAAPGQVVRFTSFAVNLGPSASQLDAEARRQHGLSITTTSCQDVSPDGPGLCEFGELAPFQPERMVVQATITGRVETVATLTVCAGNEGGQSDPVPVDSCSTTFVRIVAATVA